MWLAVALGLTVLLSTAQSADGVLWAISTGIGNPHFYDDSAVVGAEILAGSQLVGITKFEFVKEGSYDLGMALTAFDAHGYFSAGGINDASEVRRTPELFHLMVCGTADYLEVFEQELSARGSFCKASFPDRTGCKVIPLSYRGRTPENTDVPALGLWTANVTDAALNSADTVFFVLSACGFTDHFPMATIQVVARANYDFRNGQYHHLTAPEIEVSKTHTGFAMCYIVLVATWIAHINYWQSRVDVVLQQYIGVVIALKGLVVALTVLGLCFKAAEVGATLVSTVLYVRVFLISTFYLLLMERMLRLSFGYRVLVNELSPLEHLKVTRLTLSFGIVMMLFLWWAQNNLMLWALLVFLYLTLTWCINKIIHVSLQEINEQISETVALADIEHERGHTIPAAQLGRHARLLNATLRKFIIFRNAFVGYFFVAPLILIAVHMAITASPVENRAHEVLTVSEAFDLAFFVTLALNFRAQSFDVFFGERAPADIEMATSTRESGRNDSEISTVRSSAIVPVFSSSSTSAPEKSRKESDASKAEIDPDASVLKLLTFGEAEPQLGVCERASERVGGDAVRRADSHVDMSTAERATALPVATTGAATAVTAPTRIVVAAPSTSSETAEQ